MDYLPQIDVFIQKFVAEVGTLPEYICINQETLTAIQKEASAMERWSANPSNFPPGYLLATIDGISIHLLKTILPDTVMLCKGPKMWLCAFKSFPKPPEPKEPEPSKFRLIEVGDGS